ncbi:prepilin peptidase [Schaalia sp. ZJ405]|uniref:prepilin peptidase n=1 Tax=Schaalia sp. ZJ405 TaxID=2709403 RepID=UPI0013EB88B1|nr:A24 family peptidase [Schaalia sp. ZJ405]QPK80504.1 prepilin peptidase [Schaalia sp. ZJ405]
MNAFSVATSQAHNISLVTAVATWIVIVVWLWKGGWRIQRRYFIEAALTPFRRNGVVWTSAIVGAIILVAAHQRPAAPAIVGVAMIGILSGIVDGATHRLPNGYSLAMAIAVIFGVGCASVTSSHPVTLILTACGGGLLWAIPAWILNRFEGGLGYGDVKLAPVLGFMLGSVGLDCAVGGFLLAFVAAGIAAMWRLIVGAGGTDSRMPMGPWLIGGALVADICWGIVPDWM